MFKSKLFFGLAISMAGLVAISNFLVQFPVNYFGMESVLTYAAFTYPITFLITDLANYKQSNPHSKLVKLHFYAFGGIKKTSDWLNLISNSSLKIFSTFGLNILIALSFFWPKISIFPFANTLVTVTDNSPFRELLWLAVPEPAKACFVPVVNNPAVPEPTKIFACPWDIFSSIMYSIIFWGKLNNLKQLETWALLFPINFATFSWS